MERREDRARAKEAPVRERTGEEKPAPEKTGPAQKKQRALQGVGYVAVVAVFSALLLGAQYALWFVKGVEVVTVLLLVFSYRFGVKCGVLSAVAFSLLRCLLFGFFPNVVLLYLIYYPLFAACFGILGNVLRRRVDLKTQLLVTALAVLFTALFTLLDDAQHKAFIARLSDYQTSAMSASDCDRFLQAASQICGDSAYLIEPSLQKYVPNLGNGDL